MADQAEVAIIKAAFAFIAEDEGVQSQFPALIRLTESITELLSYSSAGTLVVAGFPVRPKDFPSRREIVMVDLHICPYFRFEETTEDSGLEANAFFGYIRKLLNQKLDLMPQGVDAVLDLDWRRTVFDEGKGVKIPIFVARYQGQIDVMTGNFV